MKLFVFSISLLITLTTNAQNQGNIWFFGAQAGLDFNNNPPTALLEGQTYFPTPLVWNEGSSVISDSLGALLFYTNGEQIWNSNHEVMPNGDNLLGHASSTESSIIVPLPNSQRYFYVFTTDATENNFANGLRYSIVDMCLDNKLGDVMETSKNILLVESVAEKLSSVKHSNGTDYWIITHKYNSDAFYSLRLSSEGLTDTIISNTGTTDPQGWGGQMVVSPNGQKIAYAIPNLQSFGKSLLLDFDTSSGILSNEQTLSTGGREWGVSFSSDNSKLYFSTAGFGEVFQYDLNAGNISEIIDSKTYLLQDGPDNWRHHSIGPDGKIYISRSGKDYLSSIESPNTVGIDCNYIDSAIYLGGNLASFGLPNFIAGFEYHNEFVECSNEILEHSNRFEIKLYPNPMSQSTILEFANNPSGNYTLVLLNSSGQIVKNISNITSRKVVIEKGELSSGLYYLQLFSENELEYSGQLLIE